MARTKITQPQRIKPGRFRGDGYDEFRIKRAEAKRRRRAQRNIELAKR